MNRTSKLVLACLVFLAYLVLVLAIADAHEGHGFKHMTGSSGSIIGQKPCPTGLTVWYMDHDEDGVVDSCKLVLFEHGVFHTAPARMTMEINYNGQNKIGCSCEPIENSY